MTTEKPMSTARKDMSIVKKMMIALVGGLVVGIGCLFLREHLVASGNADTWKFISMLLFDDITAKSGVNSIGIIYIIGQIFMRGLQMAIVPLILVSLSLAMCSVSDSTKLGAIAGKTIVGFISFYVCGAAIACFVAGAVRDFGLFNVALPTGLAEAKTIEAFNPIAVILNAFPVNIIGAGSTNNSVLASVLVAIIRGLCLNQIGEKGEPLKKFLESANEVIQLFLNFWIMKVGPFGIFCLIARTFAIYGVEYLLPVAAYVVSAMATLFVICITLYPIGIYVTTGLNPLPFLRKVAKIGIFGFSTNSSAACLPLNTRTNLRELGCSPEITNFVLPTGMTINMNGTTVMHMFAVTFIATAAGIEITVGNMVAMAFLSICAAMGTPAIPVAGTTMIFTVLNGMGWTSDLCLVGFALVMAINRPVEMALLPLNVIGDAAVNLSVNAKQGDLNKEIYYS